jgi:MFS family permease
LTTWTQTLLDPAGVSVGQVGIILTSCVLAGVVGTVVIPVLAARRRKEIRTAVVGIVVIAAGCVVLALVPGFGTGLVSLSLTGLLLLPLLAIILELVERSSGDADGVTAGLVWTMGTLGGLVVTGVVGFTLDRPTVSFLILTAVALLGLPLLARLRHPVANMASGDVQAESADPAEPAASPARLKAAAVADPRVADRYEPHPGQLRACCRRGQGTGRSARCGMSTRRPESRRCVPRRATYASRPSCRRPGRQRPKGRPA